MIVKRLGLVEYAPALEAMRVFTAARGADTLNATSDSWTMPRSKRGHCGKIEK